MKSTIKALAIATLFASTLFLAGCDQDTKTTQETLNNNNPELSSVKCNQENVDNYGTDVCSSQRTNSDGSVNVSK